MTLKNVEKLEKSMVKLTIAVSAEELEAAKADAYKKGRKNIQVPGFRKGKAPRQIIEKLYGPDVFLEEAINESYPQAYEQAMIEAKINPVDVANIEMQDMEDGGYTFVATVAVEPEITIGEYKGLTAEKPEAKVLAADVKAELTRMAENAATEEVVDRAIKKGDTAVIDFEGSIDGVPFDGGKAENYSLVIGSGSFIPGFEDQLIGVKAGEEKDVVVTFPEDYHAEELKGKEATFKCKVHEVKEKSVPKIDDELAKDVSEFETLDELKKDIKAKLLEGRKQAAEDDFTDNLFTKLLETMKGDIPDAMYERHIDNMVEDFGYRLQSQGMDLDNYLQMTQMNKEDFRNLFREQAERQVKIRLALEKIMELENLEATEDDINEEYKKMAEAYGVEEDRLRKAIAKDTLIHDIKMNKAKDLIKANAKAVKPAKKAKETEAESDAAEKDAE